MLSVWGMEKSHNINFRKEVLKALFQGIIDKVEAKECLKRGLGKEELPIFYFHESEISPLKNYIDGLEKMGMIEPLIRLDGSFQD